MLIGQNLLSFDLPVLKKCRGFQPKPGCLIRDTLVCSRLIWTDLAAFDMRLVAANKMPPRLVKSHSLEAWGYRLGILKGDFGKTTDWSAWSRQMQSYCEQDVEVTHALWNKIVEKQYSEQAIQLEHDFRELIDRMERHGFPFNEEAAASLASTLAGRRAELTEELQRVFPPLTVEYETPKKKIKKTKTIVFNPASRDHVANRLKALGWTPSEFTDTGKAKVDEDTLESLPYPAAKPLAEFFRIGKILGQVANGGGAWLKVSKAGVVYPSVNTNGAVTGRCTHSVIVNVPRVGSFMGAEMRGLFHAPEGMVLVGADASGLELRCLAHYLAPFDGGEYAKIVCEGDVHTTNQAAFGLSPGKPGRQNAKNGIYALIYGAGPEKLGATLGPLADEFEELAQKTRVPANVIARMREQGGDLKTRVKHWRRGSFAKARVAKNIKGYGELCERVATLVAGPIIDVKPSGYKVRDRSKARGYLIGLDGRRLNIRSEHAALNSLLQGGGSLLVKLATVLWDRELQRQGLRFGPDYALVGHFHDEIQAPARRELAEQSGKTFIWALQEAGRIFKFRCPLTGEFKIGKTWADTH